jgi:hypothetical protein
MEPDPLIGEEGVADEEESEQFDLAQSFGEIFSFDSPLQPVANTAIGASGDDSVIVVFDPQATPEARAATSNLVVASAAIAGVVALAGAAGAASTAALASAPSSFSGGGGGGASLGRGATMNEDSLDALAVADYTDRRSTNRRTGKGDQLRIWRFKWMTWWDKPSRAVTQFLAPISPLVSKLSNDAAYLRSMVGSLSLLVPATAVIVALFALGEGEGVLLHPPVYLYALMMIIGVFDAFAGSLAMSIFVLGSLPLMNVYSIEDWRLLAGIIVSGFGPIIVARSVRDFRRAPERGRGDWIVTLGDVAFASLMGGWVAGLIVRSLPALTGLTVPAANYVISFQVWATFAIGARVLLESVATRGFPGRMNVLSPWVLKEPPPFQKVIAQIGRLGFYIFIASSFMGFGPVVLAAGLMFLAPSILRELSDRLPQSRVLWQIFPTGLAGLAMILGLEIVLEQSLSQWLGDHPDFSIIFIISLLALILTMSILGILGREPAPGARHWTQNPTFRFWRRFGAVSVFIMLFLFTGML